MKFFVTTNHDNNKNEQITKINRKVQYWSCFKISSYYWNVRSVLTEWWFLIFRYKSTYLNNEVKLITLILDRYDFKFDEENLIHFTVKKYHNIIWLINIRFISQPCKTKQLKYLKPPVQLSLSVIPEPFLTRCFSNILSYSPHAFCLFLTHLIYYLVSHNVVKRIPILQHSFNTWW